MKEPAPQKYCSQTTGVGTENINSRDGGLKLHDHVQTHEGAEPKQHPLEDDHDRFSESDHFVAVIELQVGKSERQEQCSQPHQPGIIPESEARRFVAPFNPARTEANPKTKDQAS